MPARDLFHGAVKNALIKEGWTITDAPLTFKIEDVAVSIDLGAENLLAAEKEDQKIAVEIKSFLRDSPLTDYHTALGQFLNYRLFFEIKESDRQLFLAIPLETYISFFQKAIIQKSVEVNRLRLIVYNSTSEVITTWIR